MKSKTCILALTLLLFCCTEQKSRHDDARTSAPAQAETDRADLARQWLIESIHRYFAASEADSLNAEMKEITTPEYYEYKTDATNVGLDIHGSLTEEQFHRKWQDRYNTRKAGIGTGFLISGQDWSRITIPTCRLLSATENGFLFDVILKDEDFREEYPVNIRVIFTDGKYLIADITE